MTAPASDSSTSLRLLALDANSDVTITTTPGPDITAAQLAECTALFSAHYGVWSARAPPPLLPGEPPSPASEPTLTLARAWQAHA